MSPRTCFLIAYQPNPAICFTRGLSLTYYIRNSVAVRGSACLPCLESARHVALSRKLLIDKTGRPPSRMALSYWPSIHGMFRHYGHSPLRIGDVQVATTREPAPGSLTVRTSTRNVSLTPLHSRQHRLPAEALRARLGWLCRGPWRWIMEWTARRGSLRLERRRAGEPLA